MSSKHDYISTTSQKVINYLRDRKIKLTEEDKTFIRVTINEATSSAWEEAKHDNGCMCGQPSCPICG